MEVTLEDIQVMFVRAEGGSEGAKEAFDKLESRLPSLRGRKFYGTYHAGEYRACVALRPEDDPSAMGLDVWVIPGGRYVRAKVKDWSRRIPEIGKTFTALAEQYPADPSRPSIEYYRSQQELILHLPVSSSGG